MIRTGCEGRKPPRRSAACALCLPLIFWWRFSRRIESPPARQSKLERGASAIRPLSDTRRAPGGRRTGAGGVRGLAPHPRGRRHPARRLLARLHRPAADVRRGLPGGVAHCRCPRVPTTESDTCARMSRKLRTRVSRWPWHRRCGDQGSGVRSSNHDSRVDAAKGRSALWAPSLTDGRAA